MSGLGSRCRLFIAVFLLIFSTEFLRAQAPVNPQVFSWAPPDIDHVNIPANTDVPCSLDKILPAASKRVQELVDNMQRFSATERVEFQEANRNGVLKSAQKATFTYVAYIHEVRPRELTVEEYRNDSVAAQQFPSRLATTGTAAFALLFHPNYLKDFTVACEGLTEWNGHRAWRVHLSQTQPNNFRGYRLANRYFRVMLKARAWIDADTFQVLHLETNLRDPIEEIPLRLETVIVDYGNVEFPKRHLQLWLPQSADIYMDYRGHRFHHQHRFSNFQLFSVETTQTDQAPK